jgi:hypothetical protein
MAFFNFREEAMQQPLATTLELFGSEMVLEVTEPRLKRWLMPLEERVTFRHA